MTPLSMALLLSFAVGPAFNAAFMLLGHKATLSKLSKCTTHRLRRGMNYPQSAPESEMLDLNPMLLLLAFAVRLCGFFLFKPGQYVSHTSLGHLPVGCASWKCNTVASLFSKHQCVAF